MKNIGESYILQPCLLTQELEQDNFFEDIWEAKENEWLLYLKNNVLLAVFSYARYSEGMEELTGFGMKNSLTLPSRANKNFKSLRDENDEPIYSYNEEFMRHFVRQSIKEECCSTLDQYYKSTISDQVFNIMSQVLGVNGNLSEILDKNFEKKTNKHRKIIEHEYDAQYKDYRDNDQEKRIKFINNKLSKLPRHEKLQKLNLIYVMMDFDATSLYHSAMWDEKSVYPKIKTGFAFKPQMNKTYVDAFNIQSFNQTGNESTIFKRIFNNPRDLINSSFPVKEKVENIQVNTMRNVYIIDKLTSVDIQKIVKFGGKKIRIYKGVIYRENFKISPFTKFREKIFALRQKYKDE